MLTVDLSLGGGYDDNIFAQEGISEDPRHSRPAKFGSLAGRLAYTFSTPRLSISVAGGTNGRFRPRMSEEFAVGYGGMAGVAAELWRGGRLTATQSVSYQPYFVLNLFPSLGMDDSGHALVDEPEFAAIAGKYLGFATRAGLSQQVSRRGTLSFSYQQQVSDFSGARTDFTSRSAGGRYTHGLAQGLSLRLGYDYREMSSLIASRDSSRVHNIDAGVDFNRALSFSRRTSMSFSTGSSAVANVAGTRYHLTAAVRLRREIGRTWTGVIAYDRGVQFVDTLADPILADGAAFTLGGMLSRRLQFRSRAAVSFGHPRSPGAGTELETQLATAALGFALTRHANLGVEYSYYRYQFGRSVTLPIGVGRRMDRQSIRAYVSLWAPLYNRARRPDATR